jgi:hypothetical protein
MNNLYIAKKTAKTENGNSYTILQDGGNSFHISVTANDITLYEYFSNVPSVEYLEEQVLLMESSLLQPSVESVEVVNSTL